MSREVGEWCATFHGNAAALHYPRVELSGEAERLVVASRGNRAVIGRFLAPAERERVAEQLKAALAEMRAPRYRHDWDSRA